MNKEILVYSNCQNVSFYMDMKSTYHFVSDADDGFLTKSYDQIFTQPMFDSINFYTTMDVLRKFDPEKVVIYPNYHISSYFHDVVLLHHVSEKHDIKIPTHYREIIKGYIQQMTTDEIYQSILDYKLSSSDFENITMHDILHSEHNLSTFTNLCPNIIHSGDFLLQNYKQQRLGYTTNHPTMYYFTWLMHQIYKYCPFEVKNREIDMYNSYILLIYPSIKAHIATDFNNSFVISNHGVKLDLKGMINAYVNVYNEIPGNRDMLTGLYNK